MQRQDTRLDKNITLLLCLLSIILWAISPSQHPWGAIYVGSTIFERATYPFFHANLMHLALNIWVILNLVFNYGARVKHIIIGYVIAVLFPVDTIYMLSRDSSLLLPTVGLSSIIFAMIGLVEPARSRRVIFYSWVFAYLILGFILPATNGWVHLYCFSIAFALRLIVGCKI